MLDIERILRQDRLMRAMTGLNRQAFEALLPSFAVAYRESLFQSPQPRQRGLGGGRKARLDSIESKLVYILVYCKCYPTFDLAGVLFGFDRSQAHEWTHRLMPILETALGHEMVLPERQVNSVEAFIERFPDVKRVIIDATERPIQRPQDPERQKANYSGKKKRHTRKHLAAVDEQKRILILSQAHEGKVHDKRMLEEEDFVEGIPEEIPIDVDLGFLGLQKEYENIRLPHKKPRGGELTPAQKEENRVFSGERVVCENAFAGVKRYNIVAQVYRNRVTNFDDRLMLVSAGLWNFYLEVA